jgi:tripartite-type tricarboxylate transporter receptor subunit TctC
LNIADALPLRVGLRSEMSLRLVFWAASIALCASIALAQTFPSRPVRVLVPLPPAGAMDNIVRAVSQRLAQGMGQNFIIDNRPGRGRQCLAGDRCSRRAGRLHHCRDRAF